jgi:hypothetical protein
MGCGASSARTHAVRSTVRRIAVDVAVGAPPAHAPAAGAAQRALPRQCVVSPAARWWAKFGSLRSDADCSDAGRIAACADLEPLVLSDPDAQRAVLDFMRADAGGSGELLAQGTRARR